MRRRALCCILLTFAISSCADLPRDSRDTTNNVIRSGRLRVGLIENPPWVIRTTGEPAGAEVEMVRQFASSIGAKPEWHWGGDEKLMGALERYELDLVAGGITTNTPWAKRVGLTSYFFKETYDIGVPAGTDKATDIRGQQVAVGKDQQIAGVVREQKGQPIESVTLPTTGLVAGPVWKLQKLGFIPSGKDLLTEKHVIATGPGENQMIMRLDRFFSGKNGEITDLLQQQPEVQ